MDTETKATSNFTIDVSDTKDADLDMDDSSEEKQSKFFCKSNLCMTIAACITDLSFYEIFHKNFTAFWKLRRNL